MTPEEQRKRDEEAANQYADSVWGQVKHGVMFIDILHAFNAGLAHCRDTEVKELREQLRVAVETIKFYADRNSWKLPSFTSDVKEVIEMSDLGCKSFSGENNFADYAIPSGGRRARETLAALEGKES